MEKINKIENVLDFYVKANALKTKVNENNYSVADTLFGSITLATAIDSEFKETTNLAKVYRMLLLDEFSVANPYYDFSILERGDEFKKELIEARRFETLDSKLAFKYKMMDMLLTSLIKEKEGKIDELALVKDGSKIIAALCKKEPKECEKIFRFYYLNFRLKNKVRTGWDDSHWNIRTNRRERVSEHVVSSMFLEMVMHSEFEYKIDNDKALKMLAIHEVGETLIGDITPFDNITPRKKKEIERKAVKLVLSNLTEKESLYTLWLEFDNSKSKNATGESRCSHYNDKMDADLQSRLYQDMGLHNPLNKQKHNVVFSKPSVKEMLKNGAKEPFDIWYGWDKKIYEKDLDFPEFFDILKIAKENNLLELRSIDGIYNKSNHVKTLTRS